MQIEKAAWQVEKFDTTCSWLPRCLSSDFGPTHSREEFHSSSCNIELDFLPAGWVLLNGLHLVVSISREELPRPTTRKMFSVPRAVKKRGTMLCFCRGGAQCCAAGSRPGVEGAYFRGLNGYQHYGPTISFSLSTALSPRSEGPLATKPS